MKSTMQMVIFEKHGVSQDASKRDSKKEVNGGTVKVLNAVP